MGDSIAEPKLLTEATVQEIQLELIRRTSFNLMDGANVYRRLQQHRDLWLAVLLDRTTYSTDDGLPHFGLIKLRDLVGNFWNADTLFILCETAQDARRLAAIIEDEEKWDADCVTFHENQEAAVRALGTSEGGYVVSLWWD